MTLLMDTLVFGLWDVIKVKEVFMLLTMKRMTVGRVGFALALIAVMLSLGILTGRRKMLVEMVAFVSIYLVQVAWFQRGATRGALALALMGLIGMALFSALALRKGAAPLPRSILSRTMALRCQCERHRTAHRPQFTAQAQLSSAPDPLKLGRIQLAAGRQHGQGNGKVEGRTLLTQIRRSQVHDHPGEGHAQMAVADGGSHALP